MKDWTQGRCDSNGISLRYFRSGGDRPPLVLVHGFTDNALYYTRLAQTLRESFDVVAYDGRGHGQSDRAGGRFNDEIRVADLHSIVTSLGLDRPVLIGHSMGAAAIALAAAQYPELSRAIVLEDPAWWEIPVASAADQETIALARRNRNAAWCADISRLQQGTWDEGLAWRRADAPGWSEEDVALSLASRFEVELDLFTYYPQEQAPWRESVAAWKCPSLLVLGDNERGAIITRDQALEAARINPLAQYVHISGAGHAIRYEQFSGFSEAITRFLTSIG